MKLLFITNGINKSGGLERVLASRTNYLIDKYCHDIHILTLNNGYQAPFYKFNSNITFHDVEVKGNFLQYFLCYKNGIKGVLRNVKPDIISVCDDGLKGMFFCLIFRNRCPVIYERHVSKKVQQKTEDISFFQNVKLKFIYFVMRLSSSLFDKFVVLTNGNSNEWKLDNLMVIPNALPFEARGSSSLTNKKVLVLGRQSFQKGYDRLLQIWAIVSKEQPEWELEIYGSKDKEMGLESLAKRLGVSHSVTFFDATKDVQKKYKQASLYLMTSRFEGFGMVLIEAMSYGVPCIAFDCPYGPGDIIKDGLDGSLIKNGDIECFARVLLHLMDNDTLRKSMGSAAKVNVMRYSSDEIVPMWDELYRTLVSKS